MPVEIRRWDKKQGKYVVKNYETVAERLMRFRDECPIFQGWGINTDVAPEQDYARAVAWIVNPEGVTVAVGHAEEERGAGINESSVVENAETSAIGRALMSAGFGGGEIEPGQNGAEKIRTGNSGTGDGGTQEVSMDKKDHTGLIGEISGYLESLGYRDRDEKLEAVNSWLQKLGYDPVESSKSIPVQAMPSLIESLKKEAAANNSIET